MSSIVRDEPGGKPVGGEERSAESYAPPTILTYTAAELFEQVGPAQGYTGTLPGADVPL